MLENHKLMPPFRPGNPTPIHGVWEFPGADFFSLLLNGCGFLPPKKALWQTAAYIAHLEVCHSVFLGANFQAPFNKIESPLGADFFSFLLNGCRFPPPKKTL